MPPRIETARLTLRAAEPEDFQPYYEQILASRAVMRWITATGEPRTLEEARRSFARLSEYDDVLDRFWMIVERSSGQLAGHAILQRLDKGELIEVGYALGERWWGAGIASEAARAVVDFGFATTDLDMIVGIARPENTASRRVLEKTGLTYTGMRRYYGVDVAYYELRRTGRQKGHIGPP